MKKILCSVLGLVLFVVVAFAVLGLQSRDASAPGMTDMQLAGCGEKPNCVTSMADTGNAAYVLPFTVESGSEDAIWSRLIESIGAQDGVLNTNAPPYLAATFTSKLFGFVDDFECVIDQDLGVIHVRAGARVGHSDFNVNRERVERIRELLAQ